MNKIKYIMVSLGLTAVITVSLFLPQKVAVWQDNNRLDVVRTQTIDPFTQSDSGGNEIIDSLRFLQNYRQNASSDFVSYMDDSTRWSREEIIEQYCIEIEKLFELRAVEETVSSRRVTEIYARLYVNKSAGQARIYWSIFCENGIEALLDDITGKIVFLQYNPSETYTAENMAIIEAWAAYFGLEPKAVPPKLAEAYDAQSPHIEAVHLTKGEESVEYLFYLESYFCVIGMFDLDFLDPEHDFTED